MGAIALPEMKKYNYDQSLATASVAAGGVLGVMIPPSVIFIVYGMATEQSVGKLFIAGILPGILMMLFAGAVGAAGILIISVLEKCLSWENLKMSLKDTTRTTAMIMLMIAGAIIFGWFMAISRVPLKSQVGQGLYLSPPLLYRYYFICLSCFGVFYRCTCFSLIDNTYFLSCCC